MRTETRVCDSCGKDLTDSGPMPTYYLSIGSPKMPNRSNMEYAVHIEPWFRGSVDVCNPTCLRVWMDAKFPAKGVTNERSTA